MAEALSCDLCGKGIEDTPQENAWHGVIPYPGDVPHTGMCLACAGDPRARAVRKRMGRALTCFVDARIPIIRDALSPANRDSFERMTYEQQADVVARLVARGVIA
jgi:hypothetical protein